MKNIANSLNFCLNKLKGGVFFLLIFLPNLVLAQEMNDTFCATEMSNTTHSSNYTGSIDPAYLASFPQRNFNVYFWDIQTDDRERMPDIIHEDYTRNIENLNTTFANTNICFNMKGYGIIENSDFYNGLYPINDIIDYAQREGYYRENAINIYIFHFANGSGIQVGRGVGVARWRFKRDPNSDILAHEIGHFLGLNLHTFENWQQSSCEHATRDINNPNFNAYTHGDKIIDTNPVPDFAQEQLIYGIRALAHLHINNKRLILNNKDGFAQHPRANEIEIALADYGFTQDEINHLKNNPYKQYAYLDPNTSEYIGTPRPNSDMFKNCEDIPFISMITSEDVRNIMGYTLKGYGDYISTGQAIRMHETIELPSSVRLHNALTDYDLFIRNSLEDIGTEPDLNTSYDNLWDSPDIWVRNLNNGLLNQEHQEPIYYGYGNNTNYVYVRVTNRSCTDYDGSDAELELTWSKTSLFKNAFLLNSQIDDSHYFNNLIDKVEIPAIPAGESIILSIPWAVPNPDDFDASINNFPFLNIMNLNWGYTLFAKINSNSDPLHSTHQLNMFKNNNNLAAKNVKIIDMSEGFPLDPPNGQLPGTIVGIGNHLDEISQSFHYSFATNPTTLWEEAEIIISMDELIWNKWEETNFMSENIKVYDKEAKQAIITNGNAKLKNLHFNPGEWGLIHVGFNFLTQEVEHDSYNFSISQEDIENNTIANTRIKLIRDNTRNLFKAEAKYEWSKQVEAYILKAMNIHENAKYNWYSPEGNLIASNMESILPIHAKGTYKLEVISEDDSYKDYDEIEISNIYCISSISPNPATTQVNVVYKTPNLSTEAVQISIKALHGGNSYSFQAYGGQLNLDLTNYSTGVYVISLIYKNEVIDSKNIIIN